MLAKKLRITGKGRCNITNSADISEFIPAVRTNAAFLYSAFYKLSLRRYAANLEGDVLRLRPALNYLDYKKVRALCVREADKRGVTLEIGEALRAHIDQHEMYVAERSRLGMELKEHDEKLRERFEAYRTVVDAGMTRKLRERQIWDSFFMCSMQKSANFSVPGSGKTASVLGMYAFLKSRGTVRRIVVICPKNAFGSWIDEFSVCFASIEPLRVLNIHSPAYKATADRRRALLYESGPCNLILVNYESVGGVLDALSSLAEKDTLLVFDEVHKAKRIGGIYADNAVAVAKGASYVVALTGTPLPNSYTDIYNLLHILFPAEYDTFFGFSPALLKAPTAGEINEINDKLQPFFCRTTKDQLGVPRANEDRLHLHAANGTENRLLHILLMRYRKNKLGLLVRVMQMETNPHLLLERLDLSQFEYLLDDSVEADEIDFADYSEEVRSLIEAAETPTKFTRCIDLAADKVQRGKTVIIWCIFVDSIHRLSAVLEEHGIRTKCIYGEVPLEERQQIITDFKNGAFQVLLTNPHTLAESVSLHTACHDAIYYEYSYNLVHLLQSKDRIHRLGLPDGQYTQYDYLQIEYETEDGAWSMDGAVYDRLMEKEQIMLDAIDNHVLEAMPTSEEDLDKVFAKLFE